MFFKRMHPNRLATIVRMVILLKLCLPLCATLPKMLPSFLLGEAAYARIESVQRARDALSKANTLLEQGNFDEAIATYKLALHFLDVRQQDPIKSGIFVNWQSVSEPELAGEILQHKAKAQFQIVLRRRDPHGRPLKKILNDAFDSAAASKTLLEAARLRLDLGDEKSKLRIAKKLRNSYDLLIEIIYLRNKGIEDASTSYAFSMSQRSKGRSLLDLQWAKQHLRFFPRNQQQKLRMLLSQVALVGSIERALAEEQDVNQPNLVTINQLRSRLKSANKRLQQIESELKRIDPSFSRSSVETSFLEEGGQSFRSQLGIKETVIQYHLTSDYVFAFVIPDVGKMKFLQLRIHPNALEEKVVAYIERLKRYSPAWKQAASDLYMELFVELKPYLHHTDRIFIVPSGILYILPFQTLFDPMTQEYTIRQFPISYLPHAELLGVGRPFREMQRPIRAMVVGIGDFDPSRDKLEWSEDEARSIAASFGERADLFLGSRGEATKQKLTPLLSNYSIIHISTHAVFDPRPMHSRIILKDKHGSDTGMSAFDFLGLETGLQPGLVTLSACGTGRVRLERGDEILGLPRALFFAGARVVVASLWRVEIQSTGLLMSQFYRELAKPDVPVDEALRRAQDWLRNTYSDFSHPHFWGGFVAIGDGRVTFTRPPLPIR